MVVAGGSSSTLGTILIGVPSFTASFTLPVSAPRTTGALRGAREALGVGVGEDLVTVVISGAKAVSASFLYSTLIVSVMSYLSHHSHSIQMNHSEYSQ